MRTSSSTKALALRLLSGASRCSTVVSASRKNIEKVVSKNWKGAGGGASQCRTFGFPWWTSAPRALAMATGPVAVLPRAALPLMETQKRFSSSEERIVEGVPEATGGIVEISLAQTGEGIADCELIRWYVSEGDLVDEFAPVCEVQSDKASVVITSRYQGQVSQILHQPGDIVKVGAPLFELRLMKEGSHDDDPRLQAPSPETNEDRDEDKNEDPSASAVLATPAVRALAKDYGVNLRNVVGAGLNGRVHEEDVMNYVTRRENAQDDIQSLNEEPVHDEPESARLETSSVPQAPSCGDFSDGDTCIPVRGHRRAMAKAMTAAVAVPHFYYVEEIAMDKLTMIKRSLTQEGPLDAAGVKLTYLPFLLKALSMALKKYPVMNSTVNEAVTEIQVKAAHNIGIAMSTIHGLVVPNIKNVQRLSVLEIATELSRLVQLANANSLSSEDITGGTITVSNFGAIGGKVGIPLLNVPEVAIVAIGKMQQVMVRTNEQELDEGHVINVTWGADHRVIDGATVAHFCNEWKLLIEQPERLLLTLQ